MLKSNKTIFVGSIFLIVLAIINSIVLENILKEKIGSSLNYITIALAIIIFIFSAVVGIIFYKQLSATKLLLLCSGLNMLSFLLSGFTI